MWACTPPPLYLRVQEGCELTFSEKGFSAEGFINLLKRRQGSLQDLSAMVHLETLLLQGTGVQGYLEDLSALSNMIYMALGKNSRIRGNLRAISGMSKLLNLGLHGTEVEGDIDALAELPNLNALDLGATNTYGSIKAIGNLPILQNLALSPHTTGELKHLANLSLQKLHIADAHITGDLSAIAHICSFFQSLKEVTLHNNDISGEVPSFADCKKLSVLTLHGNRLGGTLPDDFLTNNIAMRNPHTSTKVLTLLGNHLSGKLPALPWFDAKYPFNVSIVLQGNLFFRPLPQSHWFDYPISTSSDAKSLTTTVDSFGAIDDYMRHSIPKAILVVSASYFLLLALCSLIANMVAKCCEDVDSFWRSHGWSTFLLMFCRWFAMGSSIASCLVVSYVAGASYFAKSKLIIDLSIAPLFERPFAEWSSAVLAMVYFAFSCFAVHSFFIVHVGAASEWTGCGSARAALCECRTSFQTTSGRRLLNRCWVALKWFGGLVLMSTSTVVYAFGQSMPSHSLDSIGLIIAFYVSDGIAGINLASIVLLLVSNYLVPLWAKSCYSEGNQVLGQMFARTLIVWLLPVFTVFAMNEDCYRAWVFFWKPCSSNRFNVIEKTQFNIGSFYRTIDVTLLTKSSVCTPAFRHGRCSRAGLLDSV